MLKVFLIYAFIAGVIMFSWFYTFYKDETDRHIKRVAEETGTSAESCAIVLNILMFTLGWFWIPCRIIKVIIKKVKGE